ncbi:MAG: hypothetical protein K2N85_08415, partial [Lachnospiraceae bacterium]|nr:hypothetical protein [Lachnospiraceae bacterium]
MSRKIPDQEYEKTLSFRLKRWLGGANDSFVGQMEMKPQEEYKIDYNIDLKRKKEKEQRVARAYDLTNNLEVKGFERGYRIF